MNQLWGKITSALTSVFSGAVRAQALSPLESSLTTVNGRGWFTIYDSTPGAWQQDASPINTDQVLSNWSVYACLTLISQDIGKLPLCLVEQDAEGIWNKARSAAFSPVLRKPNRYQTRQQFIEAWVLSKLGPCGNAYILKVRDNRGIVVEMHVLDPYLVTPMIAPDGSVFYRVSCEPLTAVFNEGEIFPASEIIHDRAACLHHWLIGVSPIYACGLAATQGLSIQNNSEKFFRNRSMPGGIITAPTEISDAMAERLKREFSERYSDANLGKTAVLGDGLKYEPQTISARDSQLTEQLSVTAKMVCSSFHVPPFKIGLEAIPAGQKIEDINNIYYADCLQTLIESIEALLDEGLGLYETGRALGTEFDLDSLLRMDNATLYDTLSKGVGGAILKPNEARKRANLPPVDGGDSVYLQEQNYSLSALEKRDAKDDPWASSGGMSSDAPPTTPGQPPEPEDPEEPEEDDEEEDITEAFEREIQLQRFSLPEIIRRAA